MQLHLKIWRQTGPRDPGHLLDINVPRDWGVTADMSFLEMLDLVNEHISLGNCPATDDPIEFESDCREGICGACGLVINGQAHGPERGTTACQLHMRSFHDGDVITIEPWRVAAFPVIRDLVVDRSAYDRLIQAGGYVSIRTGTHADANATLIPKDISDAAFNAATCIGCGACAAACPNASPSLFVGAKITHLALLPQGHPERARRVKSMAERMDAEGFGHCTNIGECAAACPVNIPLQVISKLKREYLRAMLLPAPAGEGDSDQAG